MSSADRTRRVALAGSLLGLACVLGLVEAMLLPRMPLPGVRLGLANIAVLIAVTTVGLRWALGVSVGRVLLVGMVTGALGGPATLLGVGGAVAAWAAIAGLRRASDRFSVVGWSVGAASCHAIAQVGLAAWLVGDAAIILLVPYSLALSAVCGLAIGLVSHILLSRAHAPLTSGVAFARGARAHGAAAGH